MDTVWDIAGQIVQERSWNEDDFIDCARRMYSSMMDAFSRLCDIYRQQQETIAEQVTHD